MKIISVVGARPNFMKIAPLVRAIEQHNSAIAQDRCTSNSPAQDSTRNVQRIEHMLVHTGQHYDARMSQSFFDALNIPRPDIDLEIGSGSHAEQVGRTMIAFEKVVKEHRPDWVVVVGDVNATCACSITAKKEHVKVAHIEAGLRSFDLEMPEEINRMVTDRLSDLLFVTDEMAVQNLRNEGVPEERIKLVGNIMIDTLETNRDRAAQLEVAGIISRNRLDGHTCPEVAQLTPQSFAVMTLHRPSNVDDKNVLTELMHFVIEQVAGDMPVVWPIHPRTAKQLKKFQLWEDVENTENIILLEPLGYHDMLKLNMDANVMLTDSGGLQEECCVLGTPCLTLRWNTERPVTLRENGGASVLVGNAVENLQREYKVVTEDWQRRPKRPSFWDGRTADRIVSSLVETEAAQV